jgi:hypothetical protein
MKPSRVHRLRKIDIPIIAPPYSNYLPLIYHLACMRRHDIYRPVRVFDIEFGAEQQ